MFSFLILIRRHVKSETHVTYDTWNTKKREHVKRSRDSLVSIATMLRAGRPRFDSRQRLGIFCQRVHPGYVAHPAPYLMGTWGCFPEDKRPAREADRSPHLAPRLRMNGAVPPLPHTSSWRGFQLSTGNVFIARHSVKPRENSTFV
jgi:hypothetical protein